MISLIAASAGHRESANGTDITTVGPIINASKTPGSSGVGNVLAITAGGQISLNGAVLGGTSVIELYYTNHTAYQMNSSQQWWGPIIAGNTGSAVANPKTGKQSGTRFPYASGTKPAQPFAYTSVWNLGIGSNAAFSGPAGSDALTNTIVNTLPVITLTGSSQFFYPYYTALATDPLFTSPSSNAADGFNPTPSFTIRCPASATVSPDSDAILILSDAGNPTRYAAWYDSCSINRTNFTINTTYGVIFWDTSSDGRSVVGQGNHHPPLQGLEIDQGFINRMLPCKISWTLTKAQQLHSQIGTTNVYGQNINHGSPYNCVWPAIASDSGGGVGGAVPYSTASSAVPFGSIIFVPPSVLTAALGSNANQWAVGGTNPLGLTANGIMIAKQMQNYGIHLENTGGPSPGTFQIYTDQTMGSRGTAVSQINAGLAALRPYYRVLLNWMCNIASQAVPTTPLPAGYQYDPFYNASAPINGGGTYPASAPYWDSSLSSTFTSQNTY